MLTSKFCPQGVICPCLGLDSCKKTFKMCLKSYFKEIVLKLTTNGQSDKGFLLTSTFVPKGLSAPALGLYTCIKALKYILRPGVRLAFTRPLVLWFKIRQEFGNTLDDVQLMAETWKRALDLFKICLTIFENPSAYKVKQWWTTNFCCHQCQSSREDGLQNNVIVLRILKWK